ncbi:Glycosyltransferase involved in cell wall bisynthesis [Pseudarthrobacter enclensis]|uniref:Glycosyl transferase n=1 Tax=Pseudarthrobacter enclensis TaxID=993070 RepID=A0A0V8IVA2_9MICC|nr:glycosyltransferase [Pseudarthrobacter enclensis]KSU78694.1 glycosyl transferase [Pseudarthrobacter enclensis]SCB75505.1 Glycosyltransferase involved in cell wall bisynthesis [Pseudarthrobacter enclensis]
MKPSVAIIGTRGYPSYYGGFETAVRKLAPFLADEGWDVTVYGRKGATRDDDSSRDTRVKSRLTNGLETVSLSTLTYGLTACLDAAWRKPDVALVMNVANGYWLPILWARGIPTLVNVDGIEWDRDKWGRVAKLVFRLGAKMTSKFGTRMVYDAEAIGQRWAKEFGVDGDFIPYGGEGSPLLPIEPGLEPRKYVLMVARFVPENTVPEFMAAAERLAIDHDVVIVGSSGYGGELEERVSDLASDNPKIHWLGHVSNDARLLSLWQHAGVYFHGHSVGGTNPALVQAMAVGAPVVARDTIYNREVLEDAGIFTSPSPTDIIDNVSRLISDPMKQDELSSRAMARAREHYTWEAVCALYEQSLLRLVLQAKETMPK